MGRHPAAVGVLADGAAPARLPARPPGDARRPGGARRLHDRRRRDGVRRLEACQSPVWDTALAVDRARRRRRRPPTTRPLARAADWLLERGDPRGRRLGGAPARGSRPAAGRSSSPTTTTPTSTTPPRSCWRCAASTAARAAAASTPPSRAAAATGCSACRARDGGWGAFDADNTSALLRRLPFCDFGEVIDPPSADVTAHVVEMLAREAAADTAAARRGVRLAAATQQERDGSWFGRWGVNHVYGTGAVVPALVAARRRAGDDRASGARCAGCEAHQNADGGWGEDLRSYRDAALERPRRLDRVADRVGAARAARRRRAPTRRRRARRALAGRDAAARRRLGRAVVHRHRLPRRLLHQLPPLPAGLPGDGARPVRPRAGRTHGSGAVTDDRPRRRTVLLAGPRSFCAGVERAIDDRRAGARTARRAGLRAPARSCTTPTSSRDLERRGAVFVDELDEVPDGAHRRVRRARRLAGGARRGAASAGCP